MQFPENMMKIVEDMARLYKEDIPEAVTQSERRIVKLANFKDEVLRPLLLNSIKELVYDVRHKDNLQIKLDTGYYERRPANRVTGLSTGIEQVYKSVYDYCINGSTLGSVKGNELAAIEEAERARANGHIFNAELARWLRSQGVSNEKTVREVVPEARLRKNFDRLRARYMPGAARDTDERE